DCPRWGAVPWPRSVQPLAATRRYADRPNGSCLDRARRWPIRRPSSRHATTSHALGTTDRYPGSCGPREACPRNAKPLRHLEGPRFMAPRMPSGGGASWLRGGLRGGDIPLFTAISLEFEVRLAS